MSDVPYYPPMAPARQQGGPVASGPLLLSVAGPVPQRRGTVAVRLILAIPHLLALYFLGLGAFVVVVIGWFGALATGQLPDFAFSYLSGYLRWCSRVEAYLLLLTDEYPPFELEDGPYPVQLAVSAGRLNRLTVAFRLILAIPAAIVSTLLTSGFATIVVFIAWLTVLFAGRLPASLHQAFTAVLRYTIRYYGYVYLLTDAYPAGLFGDTPGPQAEPGLPPGAGPGYGAAGGAFGPAAPGTPAPGQAAPYPGYGAPAAGPGTPATGYPDYRPAGPQGPGYGTPGYQTPGYETPAYGAAETRYDAPGQADDTLGYAAPRFQAPEYGAPAYGVPGLGAPGYGAPPYGAPGYGAPAYGAGPAGAPGPSASWRLSLSAGARRLVGLALLLGLLTAAGEGAWAGDTISAAIQRDREISQLNTDIAQYNNAVAQFNAVVDKHNAAVTQEEQAAAAVTAATTAISNAQDTLDNALNNPDSDATNCQTVACFNTTAVPVVNAFDAFGRTLNATAVPSGSAAIKQRLLTDTTNNQQDWTEITQATSFSSIVTIATNAETVGNQFDNDSTSLTTSLDNESTTLSNEATTLNNATPALNVKGTRLVDEGATLDRRAAALGVQIIVLNPTEVSQPQ
jgi:Domain of unknown function (DUF4389)